MIMKELKNIFGEVYLRGKKQFLLVIYLFFKYKDKMSNGGSEFEGLLYNMLSEEKLQITDLI